jgi:hypothetical protein
MALTNRIPYQTLIGRPKLHLPGGKRVIVWVILIRSRPLPKDCCL